MDKKIVFFCIGMILLMLVSACNASMPPTPHTVELESDDPKLSSQKEYGVTFVPHPAEPGMMDGGEQPGWTKSLVGCNQGVENRKDAQKCFEVMIEEEEISYIKQIFPEFLTKQKILVKIEEPVEAGRVMISDEYYYMEVYTYEGFSAVDWEGNYYYYLTFS